MTAIPRRLPDQAREWVARAIGDGAHVVSTRRLRGGGGSSDVRALVIEDQRGRRKRLVLRRYIKAEWLAVEPDLAAREARVLQYLAAIEGVPVPGVVAVDEDGSEAGAPSVLVTLVPGRLDLAPRDDRWFERLAALLPPLHAAPVPESLQPYRPYFHPERLEVPEWTHRSDAWGRALAIVRERASGDPSDSPRFVHRDFHPGNVLWSRGRVTGVVDWTNASAGPPAVDVAHCRTNLVIMHGLPAAERFREAHEGLTSAKHDPYYDLSDVFDMAPFDHVHDVWRLAGVPDLETVRARVDEYVVRLASHPRSP